jgi:hypothetical protein
VNRKIPFLPTWLLLALPLAAFAEDSFEQKLIKATLPECQAAIDRYCHDVTPGDLRVTACLYARSDKLDGTCVAALGESLERLQHLVAKTGYLYKVCRQDLHKFCKTTLPGDGRTLSCLEEKKEFISEACNQALSDTGARALVD